jgi:hypothetical protein
MKGHNGIDYGAKDGTPVYATHEGVAYIEIDSSGGNGVVIRSEDKYEYNGKAVNFKTIYWHLKENNVCIKRFQKVKAGDLIGYADNTGFSTGSHLHFALKPCYKGESNSIWYNEDQNNGYKGAIDPEPYFNGMYPVQKYNFTKTLKLGMWNSDVKELQSILKEHDFYQGDLDGHFGPMTLKAVKNFQTWKSLFSDGIVGPKTNKVLNIL